MCLAVECGRLAVECGPESMSRSDSPCNFVFRKPQLHSTTTTSMLLLNPRPVIHRSTIRRYLAVSQRYASSWAAKVANPSSQFQTYISKSRDPFVNLSIEHFLFQKTPPGSRVLFLYTNRPCIVIGRNQNPWLEVNLSLLRAPADGTPLWPETPALGNVDLVRRRSGGGTVFHDEGNVNWSVICDLTEFTRDKHAEMVVRSLRGLGIERARVNERHDIVLDQGSQNYPTDEHDTHKTPYTSQDSSSPSLKVSGSAYKLARNRALHHGTALLQSPNLHVIPHYLHSCIRNLLVCVKRLTPGRCQSSRTYKVFSGGVCPSQSL